MGFSCYCCCLWDTFSIVQGLLLPLCSGISPNWAQGTYGVPGIESHHAVQYSKNSTGFFTRNIQKAKGTPKDIASSHDTASLNIFLP